ANVEPVLGQLMDYRFPQGSLRGQSFGNLFLAALNGISDSFEEAVARMQQVLAITGRVLPVTDADVTLEATFENGSWVVGESKIFAFKKAQNCRIKQVRLVSASGERPAALPAVLEAIERADLILVGPGSLYTSIILNLLVDGVTEAIRAARGLVIYICNIMTQDGETEGYTAADHLGALLAHTAPDLVDLCLVNSSPVRPGLAENYRAQGAFPIAVDRQRVEAMGVELVERPIAAEYGAYARHSVEGLAAALMELYGERADTKVF
ncbi:MAG: YvcK family protein, partial [Clostridiales bacterium]|nr:YvcK family protein [Clostridiales bacterium]